LEEQLFWKMMDKDLEGEGEGWSDVASECESEDVK